MIGSAERHHVWQIAVGKLCLQQVPLRREEGLGLLDLAFGNRTGIRQCRVPMDLWHAKQRQHQRNDQA